MSELHERSPGSNHGGNRLPGAGRRLGDESPRRGSSVEARAPISVRRLAEVLSVRATCALRLAYEELGLGRVHLYTELDAETAARIARALDVELRVVE